MKTLIFFSRAMFLMMICACLAGCASSRSVAEKGPLFRDAAQVNAVLRFSSWDYTFLVKPHYSENGFLQQVGRDNLDQVFENLNVPRGTAVVMVGWTYRGQALDDVVAGWKTILGSCGFQRVVILRADNEKQLNGAIIVDDSILSLRSAQAPAFPATARY